MIEKREDQRENSKGSLTGAPYLAKIIGHADLLFQGGLEVVLIRDSGNQVGNESQTYLVKYASPFYGCTPYEFTGQNVTADDAQTSYGFWGVPPDTGVTGIVMFIDGKPDQGFWIASVQDKFQNHMIPAIGGTTVYATEEDYKQEEHPLPVVEHNRKANEGDKNLEIEKIPRAVHPIASRFKTQGLTRDEVRGTSTSTSRRDVPNMVFGMSSPGPLNRDGKKKFLGNRESPTPTPVSVQRLGGTQFVMDDGDDRYYRENKPSEGPPNYLNFTPFQLGNKDVPYNEHFRIRTRTGHQLLFHNSEDLIYIGNSRGTAWIEFTSDGKIDIYAEDSINIRTKQDFNFVADRDINMEAGRNFNIKVNGEMHTHVVKDHILIVDENQKIQVKSALDETIGAGYKIKVTGDNNVNVSGSIKQTSGGSNETKAGGNILETAPLIHMNGPGAATAETAEIPKILKTHILPDLPAPNEDDVDKTVIVRRMPTAEPYPFHENLDATKVKPDLTDRDVDGRYEGESSSMRNPPSDWRAYKKPKDNPF